MHQTQLTAEAGNRTWFGTLTLSPEWQAEFLARARDRWMAAHSHSGEIPEWWEQAECDERFRLTRKELVKEVQRFWKRLRKKGHQFKYLLVFERHKSGLPHMHFLLHETGNHILKKQIQAEWPFGFSNVKLVRGDDLRKAAWYVVKYLSKSVQARQLASLGYVPDRKDRPHGPNARPYDEPDRMRTNSSRE